MNDALFKILNFIRANFWDWQFFAFVFFASLAFCFYILDREKSFKGNRVFDFVLNKTGKSDRQNCLFILAVNVLAIALLVSIAGICVPQTHDEFGYLLAADTFLHGRLANPTPFSPRHFEFFHILIEPVYAAKFPPLQGVFLAIGIFLTGLASAGVWLSGLLASLAVYWLLRAFFSLRWSLFGTFLWVFAPLNFVWLDSYWGAHLAVTGGALSAGAVFRVLKDASLKYLFVWGLGIFLLVNSRLYEGAVLTSILVFIWIFETLKNKQIGKEFHRIFGVFLLIIFINLAWIAFYNYSITGNPLVLPYSLHHSQYHQTPLFVFQSVDEPKNGIPPIIKKLDENWVAEFRDDYKSAFSAVRSTAERVPIYLVWLTRSPFLLLLFLIGLFGLSKGEEKYSGRKIQVILAVFLVALFLTTFKGDRFLAPVVGLSFVVITSTAKMFYHRSAVWRYLILPLPLIVGGGFLLGRFSLELKRSAIPEIEEITQSRQKIVEFLRTKGAKHLIFLETSEAHPAGAKFYVYNEAEIEDSANIWAHNLSRAENRVLIEHYGNRKIWLLKFDGSQAVLTEYSE